MIVQRRGPDSGGDVQAIQVAQRSGFSMVPVKEIARLQRVPAMLVAGVGIGILLLALYYLLPRPVQRYLSAG